MTDPPQSGAPCSHPVQIYEETDANQVILRCPRARGPLNNCIDNKSPSVTKWGP